jgi:hypothetical protein
MKKCYQCGNNGMFEMADGNILCLDCYNKFVQTNKTVVEMLHSQINALHRQANMITGIPFEVPYPEPVHQHINTGNIDINNGIILKDSQVGMVNTGVINNINGQLHNLVNSGNTELAQKVKDFSEQVIGSETLVDEKKDEIIKLLNQILEERKSKKPNINLITSLATLISNIVVNIDKLEGLWKIVLSLITKLQ